MPPKKLYDETHCRNYKHRPEHRIWQVWLNFYGTTNPPSTIVTPAKHRHPSVCWGPHSHNWMPASAGMTQCGTSPQRPKSSTILKPCAPVHHQSPQHMRGITINKKIHHKKIHLPTSGLYPATGYKPHKAAQVGLSWTASQTMGRAVRQTTE